MKNVEKLLTLILAAIIAISTNLTMTYAAGTSSLSAAAATTNSSPEILKYTLKGLKNNLSIQNFYVSSTHIYITQSDGTTTYLSRCKINSNTNEANYQDEMTLNNCGLGQTLEYVEYNGKPYFLVGCKASTEDNPNWALQIGVIQYKENTTLDYVKINRFLNLNYANKTATSVGTTESVQAAVSQESNRIIFRVAADDGYYMYSTYDKDKLLAMLFANKSRKYLDMRKAKAACLSSFTLNDSESIFSNDSCQGIEMTGTNNIYACGGAEGDTDQIVKMDLKGTLQAAIPITGLTETADGLCPGIKGIKADTVDGETILSFVLPYYTLDSEGEKLQTDTQQIYYIKECPATLEYTIKGLHNNLNIQNFYVDSDYIYVTQRYGTTTYLSRCKIDSTENAADYQDQMKLNNFGHGQTLEYIEHNDEAYFLVGCKASTSDANNWALQMGIIQYSPNTTLDYTEIKRFSYMNYANDKAVSKGITVRVDAAVSQENNRIVFRIATTLPTVKGQILTYSVYNSEQLLDLLFQDEEADSLDMRKAKSACLKSFTQTGNQRVFPNNSCQGVEMTGIDNIYVCGGAEGEIAQIAKMDLSGNLQSTIFITGLENTAISENPEIEGIRAGTFEGEPIISFVIPYYSFDDNGNVTKKDTQQIYYVKEGQI